MSTWRSHRAHTFVTLLAVAVLAGPLTPAGTAAQGRVADPGPVVTLPFSNQLRPHPTIGTPGPDELNSLVARECNNGTPLADQQWFTLPSAGTRLVVARALRLVGYGHTRTPVPTRGGVAVVDHGAGRVLGCGEDPVKVSDGQRRSLVAW